MPRCFRRILLAGACFIGLLSAEVSAQDQSVRAWPVRDAMLKNIIVDVPADGEKATKYTFHLLVIGSEKVDGRDCWKIAFVPGDQTPAKTKRRVEVHADKEQGWPRKVTTVKAESTAKIQKIGKEALLIANAESDIPIDMLPLGPSQVFEEGKEKIVFESTKTGSEFVADLSYLVDGEEKLRVRQRWTDGDGWWRYYERHVDGKLVLRARQSTAPPLENAFVKIEATAPKKTDNHPLREDKRLYARVEIEPKRPSVSHVISRIKAATGIDIETTNELADHEPDLGYITPDPKGYYAWQLMEHLAKTEMENGHWEKTKTGYRLAGTSKAPVGRDLVTSGDAPPIPSGRLSPWLVVSGVGLVVLMLGLGVVVIIRKSSAAKANSQQPSRDRAGK